ncbi:nucleotide exchange factor GrpE [Gimesia panareensis]|uniref:Protein GrpE n=1 Tax=Gimesia panareensis TaxID=2527978 RepID=A0A517QD75_9PLAN|nr:nucleotide exchange factor GrpE [Gimesia panareensis]QDT29571.1 heat shock protein GrpE [Gimesia panareensis]QDU52615.1 heat shock protein GrpE [Gimesia panareensis]
MTDMEQPEDIQNQTEETEAAEGSPTVEEQLETALAERDENQNRFLRSQAELDNTRKRHQRELAELRQYAAAPFVQAMLPALDNLKRAVEAAENADNVSDLKQGVEMVAKQILDVFAQHNVKAIEAVGQPFDPNRHEALQQMPSEEYPPMTVIQELEQGFILNDRVVRPSKVIVSSGPAGN